MEHTSSGLEYYQVGSTVVKRTTASGRRMRHKVLMIAGNKKENSFGFGIGKHAEFKQAKDKAKKKAEKNQLIFKLGCGSWECMCLEKHSLKKKFSSKTGSLYLETLPAPKGTGVVSSKLGKKIFELCDLKDLWIVTRGKTDTLENFVKTVYKIAKLSQVE